MKNWLAKFNERIWRLSLVSQASSWERLGLGAQLSVTFHFAAAFCIVFEIASVCLKTKPRWTLLASLDED